MRRRRITTAVAALAGAGALLLPAGAEGHRVPRAKGSHVRPSAARVQNKVIPPAKNCRNAGRSLDRRKACSS